MPQPTRTFFLECNDLVLRDRILSRAVTSGRPDDADPEKVHERIGRNMKANRAMLQALGDCGVPVIRIETNRDLDTVYQDIRAHFRVSKTASNICQF